MTPVLSRRCVLAGAGLLLARPALAAPGLLAQLQAAGKARVGLANQPPYSELNPDGSMTGIAPTLCQTILGRLGIPAMEGFVGTYGELIPGMMAGRWDFVAASLTITKARCAQVAFSDPLVFDGIAIAGRQDHAGPMPRSVAELAQRGAVVGVQAGGADLRAALAAGISSSNLRQFPSDAAMVDGILAGRVDYAIMAYAAMHTLLQARQIELATVYPVEGAETRGSGCAFRRQDTDLYDAFQREFHALKASGAFAAMLKQFGFETPPGATDLTTAMLCSA